MFFWIVYKIHIFMQCARQNPYEFFLHEYVNFVHGREKPYKSLSIKIYIFMQCAPKSFSRISRLDSMAKCVNFSHIWPCCKVNSVSWCRPNTALMCGAMESMHHSCYKEYSGHLIDLRENINTMDLRRTNQVPVVRIG